MSNLILLAVFCTGQATAAPNNNTNEVSSFSSNSSIILNGASALVTNVEPYMVKDIFTGVNDLGIQPGSLTDFNGTLFFYATDVTYGDELWKSDGTEAGTVMVKDIYPGSVGSAPGYLTVVNGMLYFSADDGIHGRELWKSDGTAAGTVMVKDIIPGSGGAWSELLTDLNGTLFFRTTDGTSGYELWKSDGTTDGTMMVKDINPGSVGSAPNYLTVVNGMHFFSADDGMHGRELWKSDGTTAGTAMVKDIIPGSGGAWPELLTDFNGTLFFLATDGSTSGYELWKSDGTTAGTGMVKDINPGSGGAWPELLTVVNGTLYFSADDGTHGLELWKSDGTVAGTAMVKDIIPGSGGAWPELLTDFNGTLFFTTRGTSDIELWKSDGTTDSTMMVKNIRIDVAGSEDMTVVNGTLFFSANDYTLGFELWKSNGTADGTVIVKDIYPGWDSSYPSDLIDVNGTLFFVATDGIHGTELWKYAVPTPTNKPPLILVHGFQALATGYHCSNDGNGSNDIQKYNGTNPALSTLGSLPDWFLDDYQVWIAHLESTPFGTPSLQTNAECLRDQITYVALQNPDNPITIIAHSMGGLVSRAAIRNLNSDVDIKALYTLGSPHAGLPTEYLTLLPGPVSCIIQPAACQMSVPYMRYGFNPFNPNINGVKYNFIGGNGGSGFLSNMLTNLGQGPNDGLVGHFSAVGWMFPNQVFAPPTWPNDSLPGQYFTNETHPAQSDPSKAYYTAQDGQGFSDAYLCIKALMDGGNPNSQDICWPALPQSAANNQPQANSATQASFTELQAGHLTASQSTTIPLTIDTGGSTLFYLTWSGGNAPSFTLNRPDGQLIDPAYALAHPDEVSYEIAAGSPSTPPFAAYNFVSAPTGIWQLNITATDAIDYRAFGLIDSSRTLVAQTNLDTYQIGDTATITATLENGGVGISGATVTAKLTRPDAVVDTIPLTDQGNGTYTVDYVIPNSSGYLSIVVIASGTDGGTAFTRQNHLQVAIQSDNLQLTGVYGDTPNDNNADGLYEKLDFTAQVNLASAGEYAVTVDLYAGDQFVTQIGDFFTLTTGVQTITLPFDGGAIRQSMLNGPYIITNLSLTPLDTGIPAQSATNVRTTAAYSYIQFGAHPCYLLTLGHTGSGANPVASPANSTGCNANEYIAGESVGLTASPAIGWAVSGWTGTDDDASTASTNTLTMPASDHTANVNYSQTVYTLFLPLILR